MTNFISSILRSLLGKGQKTMRFLIFRDATGNFEVFYPEGWRYDRDIAVVDAKYTNSFESPNGQCRFTIAVDGGLPANFVFAKYAKKELESPSAGIIAEAVKGKFSGMDCFRREYAYASGGRKYFGGGVMFYTGAAVFSVSWNAPESEKEAMNAVFEHMLDSLMVKEGMGKRIRREIAAVSAIKET